MKCGFYKNEKNINLYTRNKCIHTKPLEFYNRYLFIYFFNLIIISNVNINTITHKIK